MTAPHAAAVHATVFAHAEFMSVAAPADADGVGDGDGVPDVDETGSQLVTNAEPAAPLVPVAPGAVSAEEISIVPSPIKDDPPPPPPACVGNPAPPYAPPPPPA
jgi:hypothetical protein